MGYKTSNLGVQYVGHGEHYLARETLPLRYRKGDYKLGRGIARTIQEGAALYRAKSWGIEGVKGHTRTRVVDGVCPQ